MSSRERPVALCKMLCMILYIISAAVCCQGFDPEAMLAGPASENGCIRTASLPSSEDCISNAIVSEAADCTAGRDIYGICALHSQNISGRNITIAVIDTEFYIDRLSRRELAADAILPEEGSYSRRGRHGTACAEIIADIAPNATLYLAAVRDSSEEAFLDEVQSLASLASQGMRIDIVSCSLDFLYSNFGGSSRFCSAVENLTRNGTVWINAAGDSADKHWNGTFKDENGNDYNEFSRYDEALQVSLDRREVLDVMLSWNDSSGLADQDYDLYVCAPDGTCYASDDSQEGYSRQRPLERVYLAAPISGNYSIKIKKYDSSQAKTSLQLFASSSLLSHNREEFSLGMLASCPQVITVGAVDAGTLKLQSYSSNGPALDGRLKPDLVAPDNVSTAAYFPDKFNGSSASAPFAAAVLALALEKGRKIGFTDDETVKLLLDSALDLGPRGHDTGYGRGLINLKRLI